MDARVQIRGTDHTRAGVRVAAMLESGNANFLDSTEV